jgi:hypothetical protein
MVMFLFVLATILEEGGLYWEWGKVVILMGLHGAEVKNSGAIPPLPDTSSWRGA